LDAGADKALPVGREEDAAVVTNPALVQADFVFAQNAVNDCRIVLENPVTK
jgi:hypothetical protein